MKTCTRCKLDLDVGSFYRDKNRKDGYSSRCKTCDAESKRAFRRGETVAEISQKGRCECGLILNAKNNACSLCMAEQKGFKMVSPLANVRCWEDLYACVNDANLDADDVINHRSWDHSKMQYGLKTAIDVIMGW